MHASFGRSTFSRWKSHCVFPILCALCCVLPAHAAPAVEQVPGQYLIKYNPSVRSAKVKAEIQGALGVRVIREHQRSGTLLVEQTTRSPLNESYVKQLLASGKVAYIEPNAIVHALAVPNDQKFSQLWGLNNVAQTGGTADADIDAPEAWSLTTGDETEVVGIIDTGIDVNHPDLAANIWHNPREIPNGIDDDGNGVVDDLSGANFINPSLPPTDDNGHGTHVAGTIGAVGNNGTGVVGVNWKVKLLPLKFLDASGSGTTDNAIRAIEYAVALRQSGVPLRVLSNSWGGGPYSRALDEAIQSAERAGILFVSAAGNAASDNDATPSYPASYVHSNTIAVAAIDDGGNLATFSNFGATTVDLAAPGVNILSTAPGGGYRTLSGTSMATPHVSGVAALVLSREPNLSVSQLKARIVQTTKPLATLTGALRAPGTVDAYRAVTNQQTPIVAVPASLRYRRVTRPLGAEGDLGERIFRSDDGYIERALPFPFRFFGVEYTRIAVSANGRIIPLADGQELPTNGDYSNSLRPGINVYHDDLFPSPDAISQGEGGVWMRSSGTSVTITWVVVPYAYRQSTDPANELRIQAQLFRTGRIEFHYFDTATGDTAFDAGASATVGIAPMGGGERVLISDNTPDPTDLGSGRVIALQPRSVHTRNDFDGDGVSDLVVWRPSTGMWYILCSSSNFDYDHRMEIQLGLFGDIPIVGDFDGDDISDLAVWRPTNGTWYFRLSSQQFATISAIQWGIRGDRPLAGDVDGDGTADLVVFRPGDGFYVLRSSTGFQRDQALKDTALTQTRISAAGNGNDPLLGDFDGDGKQELTTVWQLLRFWTARSDSGQQLFSLPWGERGDTPLSCDWDGNGIDDRIQVRVSPSYELKWYAMTDSGAAYEDTFGSILDRPSCSSDFDGDGRSDLAVFRPYTGEWFVRSSLTGQVASYVFGVSGDIPL